MKISTKPEIRPNCPNFSSGPCAKRPGWTPSVLRNALLGRSHRSQEGKLKLQEFLKKTKSLLGLPKDYRVAIVPGSDTGSVEMALWSLLGERGVDLLAWESFGKGWVSDVIDQLQIKDTRLFEVDYGKIPDFTQVDRKRDIIFTWNGTTSGVCVPNGDWISDHREGLTICDATSAVFAMDLPWKKLDVTTYSWQKVLGGEAQHGMLILSPRAIQRLQTYTPVWPIPKVFRLTTKGKLNENIFDGSTINTPSMLCLEDALDALSWAENIGGLKALISRSKANLAHLVEWVKISPDVDFLAEDCNTISSTSVCLNIVSPWFLDSSLDVQRKIIARICAVLKDEGVAYDIEAYRDAPPGLRIWAGSTVESKDIKALIPWIDWAIAVNQKEFIT